MHTTTRKGSMPTPADLQRAYRGHTGVTLHPTAFTSTFVIDADSTRNYNCVLIGPFIDPDNRDVRILLMWRTLDDGPASITAYMQDADDDVILNSHAEGLDGKYQIGWPLVLS